MLRFSFVVAAAVAFLLGCSTDKGKYELKPESPAYQLAVSLSEKVPALHPDSTTILVTTDKFDVTSNEVIETIQSRLGNRTDQLVSANADQIRRVIMDNAQNIAEKHLLLTAAENAGVTITDSVVNNMLQMRFMRSGGEEKYREFLENSGISYETMEKELRDGLKIKEYMESVVANEDSITQDDIAIVYETDYGKDAKATVRHILLLTEGKTEEEKAEVRDRMQGILKQARNGEDFAELAKKYSEDPGSRDKGGLYENFGRGYMVKPFEEAAFNVPVGEISDIVETQYGYHIIKVIERERDDRPQEEVQPEIVQKIQRQRQMDMMESLKKEHNFEKHEI